MRATCKFSNGIFYRVLHLYEGVQKIVRCDKFMVECYQNLIMTGWINGHFMIITNQKVCYIGSKGQGLKVITYQNYMACRYIHVWLNWLLTPWWRAAPTRRTWLCALTHCHAADSAKWFWFLRWFARHALAAQILHGDKKKKRIHRIDLMHKSTTGGMLQGYKWIWSQCENNRGPAPQSDTFIFLSYSHISRTSSILLYTINTMKVNLVRILGMSFEWFLSLNMRCILWLWLNMSPAEIKLPGGLLRLVG